MSTRSTPKLSEDDAGDGGEERQDPFAKIGYMSFLGLIFIALSKVVSLIVGIYTFLVAGAVIVSWVRPDPYNPIVNFLYQATEPVFSRVRRFLPSFLYKTGIDWTPMLVIIILIFLETVMAGTLSDIGFRLRAK